MTQTRFGGGVTVGWQQILHGRFRPGPGLSLFLLCALYIVAGLVGHDPWKQDETYTFGMILHILQSGDWVVPQVAGEPFMEKPPLYYITAAWLAKGFSPWLELHEGARLASGLYMAAALFFFSRAAQEWLGHERVAGAVVLLLGATGLLVTHFMFTDVALFAGCAIALHGLALVPRRPRLAGLLLGTGGGICFMSKGLLLPGVLALTCLLLPLLCSEFRTRSYLRTLAVAAVAVTPWALIWPVALWHRSPELFMEWFWMNNIGRFVGFSVSKYGSENVPGYWVSALFWFAFPLFPLAIWSLVRMRHAALLQPAVTVPLLFSAIMIVALVGAATARALYALPLLMPFALLAARAEGAIPASWDLVWQRFNRLFFGAVALVVWAVWLYLLVTPERPWLAPIARTLPLDYQPHLVALSIAAALALTAAWMLNLLQPRATLQQGPMSWSAGLILLLGLLWTLWLPWINTAKSYRDTFAALSTRLPPRYDCVASEHLGESERAMLEYFDGIVTQRRELHPDSGCDLLLIQGRADDQPSTALQWSLIWQGNRQGDFNERLRLYARTPTQTADRALISHNLE